MNEGQYAEVSPAGWASLWGAVRLAEPAHPVDRGELGEYAVLLRRDAGAAARAYPAVAAHLAMGCAGCAADLEELLAFVDEERIEARSTAPRGAVSGGLARVAATLISPSSGPLTAALRGGPGITAAPPAASYQTADVTVAVRIGPGAVPGTTALTGLVAPRHGDPAALSGGRAKLLPLGQAGVSGATYEAAVDALGNFVVDGVASGAYRLELSLIDQVVVVDEVRAGDGHDRSTA